MGTIAAIATPAGRGGIGVIRLSGKRAMSIAVNLAQGLTEIIPRRAHYCNWLDADGTVIDSGIMLGFPAPASYTGEDVIEIQAHGSPVVLGALLNRIFELGARPAEPGEFTRRAVENGRLDLSQAEAVIAVIDAATVRASKQAQRHLQGEFGNRIQQVMQELTGAVAHVEACLDFPEEEVPELLFDRVRENVVTGVVEPINQWLASAGFGERLFDGATVAIIGAPNVGKSSLLNHMAGRERAIVSDIAGTTRDLLEIDFEVDGIPVRLVDTAGIRDSSDLIEREGVRRAELVADEADVVLFVADATRPETWQLADAHSNHRIDLKLMNKSDLTQGEQQGGFLHVSAKSGEGMEALHRELSRYLGSIDIEDEGVMVTHARHREALVEALAKVDRGLRILGDEAELDLVALEWRTAWSTLGMIVGVGDVETILDRIFSEFCIGK